MAGSIDGSYSTKTLDFSLTTPLVVGLRERGRVHGEDRERGNV